MSRGTTGSGKTLAVSQCCCLFRHTSFAVLSCIFVIMALLPSGCGKTKETPKAGLTPTVVATEKAASTFAPPFDGHLTQVQVEKTIAVYSLAHDLMQKYMEQQEPATASAATLRDGGTAVKTEIDKRLHEAMDQMGIPREEVLWVAQRLQEAREYELAKEAHERRMAGLRESTEAKIAQLTKEKETAELERRAAIDDEIAQVQAAAQKAARFEPGIQPHPTAIEFYERFKDQIPNVVIIDLAGAPATETR